MMTTLVFLVGIITYLMMGLFVGLTICYVMFDDDDKLFAFTIWFWPVTLIIFMVYLGPKALITYLKKRNFEKRLERRRNGGNKK